MEHAVATPSHTVGTFLYILAVARIIIVEKYRTLASFGLQ
jgi:hypothetical protein